MLSVLDTRCLSRSVCYPPLAHHLLVCSHGGNTQQSLQFLVAAMEFKESNTDYDNFTEIIDKFVRDRSPFEVNISGKSKTAILDVADAARFAKLPSVSAAAPGGDQANMLAHVGSGYCVPPAWNS